MIVRVVTLRYHDGLQGFPEQAVRDAAGGREILEVRDHFFMHGNVPHLAFVLMLADAASGEKPGWNRPPGPDPAKDLPDHLQKLYRDLRNWQNDRAKREGLPSYVIMRNTLLAEVCRKLPRTLSQLREIEGIGEGTCSKYGKDMIDLIAAFAAAQPAPTDDRTPKPGSEAT